MIFDELIELPSNTGIIDREPQMGDFVAGIETGITYEDRLKNDKWIQYALTDTDGDYQWCPTSSGVNFDAFACSNYACKHSCENQLAWLLVNNQLTNEEVNKLNSAGFIKNGRVQRLSARFNAILSGTNGGQIPNQYLGNYLYKPWDSARHDGMCPESLCPFDRTLTDWTAQKYYDPDCITQQAKEAAKIWLEVIEAKYEVVFYFQSDMMFHVKQSPLCIATGVCRPWGKNVPKCDLTSGHCTVGLDFPNPPDVYLDQDSYFPAFKTLENGYKGSGAIKGVLTPRSKLSAPIPAPQVLHNWTIKMNKGDKNDEVKKLQDCLKNLGFFPTNVPSSGFFGLITCGAVLKFQLFYKLDTPANLNAWKGEHVSTKTLNQLNLLNI